MTTTPHKRRGHAAVAAIISDIENYLPPANNSKSGYAGCRTTYGLLTRFHVRADKSETPEKEYKELQQTERDLRRRIHSLESKKGIPEAMAQLLNELRDAIADALAQGITTDFFINGMEDLLDDNPDVQAAPKENRKMVTETRYKKIWDELAAAKKLIAKLNAESNALQLENRRLNARRDSSELSSQIRYT